MNGVLYDSSSGIYPYITTNSVGCDSISNLHLTIYNSDTIYINDSVCESYSWNGQNYDSSGIYTWVGTNIYGCDSTVYLDLTVLNNSDTSVWIISCDSYTWNGNTYYNLNISMGREQIFRL